MDLLKTALYGKKSPEEMNMQDIPQLVKKKLLHNKTETLTLLLSLILAFSMLMSTVSLFMTTYNYMGEMSVELSENAQPASKLKGIFNLMQVFNAMVSEVPLDSEGNPISAEQNPDAVDGSLLFSVQSMLENIPIILIIIALVTFFIAYITISSVFSINTQERKRFIALLLAVGASKKHIKKAENYEVLYLCMIAIPIGIVAGIIEIIATRSLMKLLFSSLTSDFENFDFPLKISISITAIIISVAVIFLYTYRCTKKASKKLDRNSIVTLVGRKGGNDEGIAAFTVTPTTLKMWGISGYLAAKNYQSNIFKHLMISFLTLVYVIILLASFISFNIVENYNADIFDDYKTAVTDTQTENEGDATLSQEGLEKSKKTIEMTYLLEVYFMVAAGLIAIVSLVSTFNSVITNINSNLGNYAIIKSIGTSMKTLARTIKMEGIICSVVTVFFTFIVQIWFTGILYFTVRGVGTMVTASAISFVASFSMFILTIYLAIKYASKRIKKAELIQLLKDDFY